MIAGSGSDQRRSQSSPSSGTSVGRSILASWSSDASSGLRPPCMARILSATMAATCVNEAVAALSPTVNLRRTRRVDGGG